MVSGPAAVAWKPTRTTLAAVDAAVRVSRSPACQTSSISRATGNNARPAGVSDTSRLVRTKTGVRNSFSS
ncbi:hypothetical protein [Kribbella sp. CA-294648]|uniref:hypothetical protein n=1 Tax=Kribbella sp. CA-294648 TaxID=3239948 RepID=UPI003D89BD52